MRLGGVKLAANGSTAAILLNAGAGQADLTGSTEWDADRGWRPLGGFAKRAMDVAVALISIVLLAPLLLVVALLIRIFLGPKILFSHHRVGFEGKNFACYKFRTMAVDADQILERHLASDPRAAEEWEKTRKLRKDPRVTCLGNVLRKSSLDELPQLWNVLRGDMSLVGPRPIVRDELDRYGSYRREYLKSRPGLTGIWQTSGRSRVDYCRRVALDRYYVRRWSLWLDLLLLLKTVPAAVKFDDAA